MPTSCAPYGGGESPCTPQTTVPTVHGSVGTPAQAGPQSDSLPFTGGDIFGTILLAVLCLGFGEWCRRFGRRHTDVSRNRL